MLDTKVINQTQIFKDIDRCMYFAKRLQQQPGVPYKDPATGTIKYKKITAYCKPVPK